MYPFLQGGITPIMGMYGLPSICVLPVRTDEMIQSNYFIFKFIYICLLIFYYINLRIFFIIMKKITPEVVDSYHLLNIL